MLFCSIRRLTEKEREKSKREQQKQLDASGKPGLSLASAAPEGYAECYPGLAEMNDAIDDSDDEADYSKMDLVSESSVRSVVYCC
jgi:IK cytokine